MNVCNYCGVELDVEMNFCPLCGHKSNTLAIQGKKDSSAATHNDMSNESLLFSELTDFQKKKIIWELSSIILGSGIFVTFIIDLFINKQISWSKYTITVGLVLFINSSLIAFLNKRIIFLLSGCFLSTSILLVLLDLFGNNLGWGLKYGIPILFFIYLMIYLVFLFVKQSKQKGINVIAYVLIALGILCLCVDGVISFNLYNQVKFHWSIIVLVSVVPISGILFFIHYRLKRVTNLKKFFHI